MMPIPAASERQESVVPGSGTGPTSPDTRASRSVRTAVGATLILLLVWVFFESWLQEVSSQRTRLPNGTVVGELVNWPKDIKNGLYLLLAGLTVATFALGRRWRELRTRADIALLAVAAVMVLAGLLGTSGPVLVGEAVFVYLRGVTVFYAIRALRPAWSSVRRALWLFGGLLALNVVVALVQMVVGLPAHTGLGWVDLQQADDHRAQGLLDHPNHLGQVLALTLLGLLTVMAGRRQVNRWYWVGFCAAALGLAATQSRQSVLATLAGAAVIWLLRRDRPRGEAAEDRHAGRTVAIAATIVTAFSVGHVLARPGNFAELVNRVGGVFNAIHVPSGREECTGEDCPAPEVTQQREIRLLYFQQGARLLAGRPVLGYGVGQFGGIVAEKHDPNWETDPRFPGGFDLHGFDGITVDSFWLHLTVETGVLGLLVYLIWLTLLAVPLLAVTPRFAGRKLRGRHHARAPAKEPALTTAIWGIAALLFTVLVSVLSNSLEDAIYPPLIFAILGLAWAMTGVGTDTRPAIAVAARPVPAASTASSVPPSHTDPGPHEEHAGSDRVQPSRERRPGGPPRRRGRRRGVRHGGPPRRSHQ